jgi:two-component system nitrogen regulation sensor histidine kinase NtrY
MAFERPRPNPLILRLTTGSVLVGLLAWGLLELLTNTRLYATALIVGGAMVLAIHDLVRFIGRADHVMADALDSLAAGSADGPSRAVRAFPALARAVEAASARLHKDSLRRQHERDALKAMLDTVPSALLVLEPDKRIELANRAAFALARGDVRRLEDIAALGEDGARVIRALPAGGRAIVQAGDGRKLFASSSLMSRPGEPAVALIALQGVTEDLGVVEQQAWSELIRVLAHEMMNSLTPIVSLSESLARRPAASADAEAQAALEVIGRRSENLMAFVDRYRAMAEVPKPVLKPVALDAFAQDIARLMAGSLAAAGAVFTAEVQPSDLQVAADRGLLEQAVINLLKNALDATAGCSPPAIALACRAGEGRVLICVSDNGEGVAPDKAEAIFVPFFTSRAGGSGIGLSLARQIALAHGGQLTVRPNRPNGAVFEVSLPADSAS